MTAGEREEGAEEHSGREREREPQPRAEPPVLHRPDRADEAAVEEEGVMPERQEAGVTEQDVQADHRDRGPEGLDAERDPESIRRLGRTEPRQEAHEHQEREVVAERRPPWGTPDRLGRDGGLTRARDALVDGGHTFSTTALPSSPVGRSARTRTNTAKMASGAYASARLLSTPVTPSTKPTR